ncbi:protein yceI precursor [Corallococcus sp. H22C18031201]|uniref:YceI family protein n=1 Tax=Citreicoccus inhibens TaxID=2849499 RepID=UPI000E70F2C5|nr:YceI family protein [Citreicoccus inhibens]MBU8896097.1 YceI family protein [Citreicoccus inhibens]RJS25964.1 protein yceI precursor [Corallococcus sp. H22C18031201]
MKLFMKSAVAMLALSLPSAALASNWEIDSSHSSADFSVRHMMVSNVKGSFGKVTGAINLDDKDVTKSTVEATIDVSTVNTNEPKRDEHLKSPDFFDVTKFPTMTFKSKKVAKAGAGKLKVTGDLTLHGVTKEVVLDVDGPAKESKDPWGNTRSGVSATTKINRKDYGLAWNKALETGGVAVSEEVSVSLEIELTKKADAPATAKDTK